MTTLAFRSEAEAEEACRKLAPDIEPRRFFKICTYVWNTAQPQGDARVINEGHVRPAIATVRAGAWLP